MATSKKRRSSKARRTSKSFMREEEAIVKVIRRFFRYRRKVLRGSLLECLAGEYDWHRFFDLSLAIEEAFDFEYRDDGMTIGEFESIFDSWRREKGTVGMLLRVTLTSIARHRAQQQRKQSREIRRIVNGVRS